MNNYDGYCDSCGGYGQSCGVNPGCGCGCGNDYQACSPDYNPVTVNNSTCPNVEGSTSSGGSSYGNTSNVCVNMAGCSNCNSVESCCREGAKSFLQFISTSSLQTGVTATAYIYGNILSTNLFAEDTVNQLLSLSSTDLNNISLCDGLVRTNSGVVSLCAISLITALFTSTNPDTSVDEALNQNLALKEQFNFNNQCGCGCGNSCECGKDMAQALCYSGLGGTYTVVIEDTLTAGSTVSLASIPNLVLVALDCNIAIFSDSLTEPTQYYGIPTCKIARFVRTL